MDNLKTSFGKRKVTAIKKTSLVQRVFSDVATDYDLMNDIMSLGAHRYWKKELIHLMNIQLTDDIVDIGSGTGDLVELIIKKNFKGSIYSVDLNLEMLNIAKNRLKKYNNHNIKFLNANAEDLPFKRNVFDKYIISFCLRNITYIDKALKEALRILKPGGAFYCLEFSTPESNLVNSLYSNYKKKIIPWIGENVAKNKNAYKYLGESINQFPMQEYLLSKMQHIGFKELKYLNIFNGIVAIHIGYKI